MTGLPAHLLLYGTLRRTEPDHRRFGLHRALAFVGLTTLRGDLYDLGTHPALVAGTRRVEAELYRIADPRIVARLDLHEGHDEARPETSLFRRIESRVIVAGRAFDAWLYVYNRPVGAAPRVRGRSWPAHRRRKSSDPRRTTVD